jgi:hypothetical protein
MNLGGHYRILKVHPVSVAVAGQRGFLKATRTRAPWLLQSSLARESNASL